jgi:hypothetical protein
MFAPGWRSTTSGWQTSVAATTSPSYPCSGASSATISDPTATSTCSTCWSPTQGWDWDIVDLQDELEALFDRPVDLVPKRWLHHLIRDQVVESARPLHAAA